MVSLFLSAIMLRRSIFLMAGGAAHLVHASVEGHLVLTPVEMLLVKNSFGRRMLNQTA